MKSASKTALEYLQDKNTLEKFSITMERMRDLCESEAEFHALISLMTTTTIGVLSQHALKNSRKEG